MNFVDQIISEIDKGIKNADTPSNCILINNLIITAQMYRAEFLQLSQ